MSGPTSLAPGPTISTFQSRSVPDSPERSAGQPISPTRAEIEEAANLIRSGKLVAFPTDTFYALGANALDGAAVEKLYVAKGRGGDKPVPVLLASAEDVILVASSFPDRARALAERYWPGPLTLVLPARPEVPSRVTGGTGTVGVRVPDHELARRLVSTSRAPVTGTSANLSGNRPCKEAAEVRSQLGKHIDSVLEGKCGPHAEPSTVVDCAIGLRVLREGAIPAQEILGHLSSEELGHSTGPRAWPP